MDGTAVCDIRNPDALRTLIATIAGLRWPRTGTKFGTAVGRCSN